MTSSCRLLWLQIAISIGIELLLNGLQIHQYEFHKLRGWEAFGKK